MKNFIAALLFFSCFISTAQSAYKTEKAKIIFDAGKSLEPIHAENNQGKIVIRLSDNEVAALIPVKKFLFSNALMQQHFNENYLETDEFPKATFEGNIQDLDVNNLTEEATKHMLEGVFKIHGVAKNRKIAVWLSKFPDGNIELYSNFTVQLKDHDIKIPKLVFVKIADEAKVELKGKLKMVEFLAGTE